VFVVYVLVCEWVGEVLLVVLEFVVGVVIIKVYGVEWCIVF